MTTPRVLHFELNVSDPARTLRILQALGFRRVSAQTLSHPTFSELIGITGAGVTRAVYALGAEQIAIKGTGSAPAADDVRPHDAQFQHLAVVVRDIGEAVAHLGEDPPLEMVSAGPQKIPDRNPVAGGVRAVYLRDRDAHFVELIDFPPDKAETRWHRRDRLFLGIDHSAITVANTKRSLDFYSRHLGLKVATVSVNDGHAQEALTGLPGAKVKITRLDGEDGPGIELLEYLSPDDARPFPAITPLDLAHTETVLEVEDLRAAARGLPRPTGAAEEPVDVEALGLGYRWARLCVDPDGHAVRLVQDVTRQPSDVSADASANDDASDDHRGHQ